MVVTMLPWQTELVEKFVEDIHVCEAGKVKADDQQVAFFDVGKHFLKDGGIGGFSETFVGSNDGSWGVGGEVGDCS